MPELASLRLCFSFLRPASDLTKDILMTISPEIKASENVVLLAGTKRSGDASSTSHMLEGTQEQKGKSHDIRVNASYVNCTQDTQK